MVELMWSVGVEDAGRLHCRYFHDEPTMRAYLKGLQILHGETYVHYAISATNNYTGDY